MFSLSGKLWRVDLRSGAVTAVPVAGAAIDPRLSGDGTAIAYVSGGALRVGDGDGDRALAEPEAPLVGYGLPEHVAAESMHRMRGYWWAPDGRRLVVARVDVSPVQVWYLADPAEPTAPPTALRYPAAGTANADVTLWTVLFPTGHRPGDGPLPVLMDPYGGPGGQRVLAAQSAFLVSQPRAAGRVGPFQLPSVPTLPPCEPDPRASRESMRCRRARFPTLPRRTPSCWQSPSPCTYRP